MSRPDPTPLSALDCRAITLWLRRVRAAQTQPRTQERTELDSLMARFEAHSYRYRVILEQAALISKNPDL